MIIGKQLHHRGVQLAVNSGHQGQNIPCGISAGARVIQLYYTKTSKHFPTRVDPDTKAAPGEQSPMRLIINQDCASDYVETLAELAKYTEPDEEVQSSSVWELVEKRQERR